jgi:hypothetical protein
MCTGEEQDPEVERGGRSVSEDGALRESSCGPEPAALDAGVLPVGQLLLLLRSLHRRAYSRAGFSAPDGSTKV